MRPILLVIGVTFGCAHPQHLRHVSAASVDEEAPPAQAEEAPAVRAIRLVAHRPAHYKFVGRVRATAPNDDFVLAAKQARANLNRKAEALGADVVKIERLDPSLHGQVLIAGRAYRLAD
jgi:hypothetical protein